MINLSTSAGIAPATPLGALTLGPIDFGAISSDSRDNFIPAGVWRAVITGSRINADKNRVELLFDVAEGDLEGFFAKHPAAPDFAHTLYMSAEPKRLLHLKADLAAIATHNPGFDPFAAWNSDVRRFVGKRMIVTVHYAATVNEYGESLFPRFAIIPAQAAATGSYTIPGDVRADGTREPDEPGLPIAFGDATEDPDHEPDSLWGDADA